MTLRTPLPAQSTAATRIAAATLVTRVGFRYAERHGTRRLESAALPPGSLAMTGHRTGRRPVSSPPKKREERRGEAAVVPHLRASYSRFSAPGRLSRDPRPLEPIDTRDGQSRTAE